MNTRTPFRTLFLAGMFTSLIVMCLGGCERNADDAAVNSTESATPAPTNRVDIPPAVCQNLGITFARVESRLVSRTLRVPGRFELLPTAHREYRAATAGTVELLVQQYQVVEKGTPLYRLDSPRWREMQKELTDAEAAVKLAEAAAASIAPLFDAHEAHHIEIQNAVELWTSRVTTLEQLQAAGGARGDEIAQAKAALVSARSDLAETREKEAELNARKSETAAQLDAAHARLMFLYEVAATLTGLSATDLRANTPVDQQSPNTRPQPRWRTLAGIEVRALVPGIVDQVHVVSGGVIDQHTRVLSTVQPELVRFRAVGLQSDLPRLSAGQNARVVPAQPAADGTIFESLPGTLTLAPTADAERRTLELFLTPDALQSVPAWGKAGVSAFLEVVTAGTAGEDLAIPLRCVARDGTQAIIFRRDPANPDRAIRIEADLGIDDGRWIVIKSGVAEGDEIVLDGVYQLMVATSGSIIRGGHFHPDGTFHEGDD